MLKKSGNKQWNNCKLYAPTNKPSYFFYNYKMCSCLSFTIPPLYKTLFFKPSHHFIKKICLIKIYKKSLFDTITNCLDMHDIKI